MSTSLEPVTTAESAPGGTPPRRRPVWALPVVILAVLAVAAALVVGITGLFANPVEAVHADGTATLHGTFEPYQCGSASCDGYVQAGARSVFVVFPAHCPQPQRGSIITVVGRPAPDLGSAAYRATSCG